MPTIRLRGKTFDLDEPIFGVKAIAEITGRTARQTFFDIETRKFGFRKNGRAIVSTPREILLPLIGEAGIANLTVREVA